MAEKSNAKEFPKFYYARHMKDGVCGYDGETVLIQDDAIKNMMKSFNGKPVYILHDNGTNEERLEKLKEDSCGYITDSFYNQNDGWFWIKMMIIDDEGHKKINDGWSVSNAYYPTEFSGAGTKHNVPYDREFTNGEFTHLAIVPNPRYEHAKIFTPDEFKAYQDEKSQQLNELKNSKTEEKKGTIMNFFKMKKEEVSKVDADCFVEITNDDGSITEIAVADMIAEVVNAKEDEQKMNMDDEVEVGDEKMPLKELINKYQKLSAKKNADDEEKSNEVDEEKSNEDDEKENTSEEAEKENEADKEEKENEGEEEKTNNFEELKNAENASYGKTVVDLGMDKLARGRDRY